MIKIQIIGHLGKDCLVKEVNGRTVINFSVCHTEKFKDAQGVQREKSTWVECAYWTDKTSIAQYLTKGKPVFAEGQPEADAYVDRNNQAQATLRMRCHTIQLLGGSGTDQPRQQNQSSAPQAQDRYAAPEISQPDAIDDLPF